MQRVCGCDIDLTRGDTFTLRVCFRGRTLIGTRAIWTLRRQGSESPALSLGYEVTANQFVLALSARETKRLSPGVYSWDIRLRISENEVITPFVPAKCTVWEAIGDVS